MGDHHAHGHGDHSGHGGAAAAAGSPFTQSTSTESIIGDLTVDQQQQGHGDHGAHGHGVGTMMHMSFQAGVNEVILFDCWKTTGVWSLVGSMFAIFAIGFFYEALKFYREQLYRRSFQTIQYGVVTIPVENGGAGDMIGGGGEVKEIQKTVQVQILSSAHLFQTILHVLQVIISYLLMLIVMTYNVWLCLAVVLGAGTGYFVFGWKKSLVVDVTENCH